MINKSEIIKKHCYTELVYFRINKKLKLKYSNHKIERLIYRLLDETPLIDYLKKGKNFYVVNRKHQIKITVNSNTFRVITVDKITTDINSF